MSVKVVQAELERVKVVCFAAGLLWAGVLLAALPKGHMSLTPL